MTTRETAILVDDEPLHKEHFKNSHVRIYKVVAPKNTETLWRTHLLNTIFVAITDLDSIEYTDKQSESKIERGATIHKDYRIASFTHKALVFSDTTIVETNEFRILKTKEYKLVYKAVVISLKDQGIRLNGRDIEMKAGDWLYLENGELESLNRDILINSLNYTMVTL
ncbi:hypothetical protein HDV06_005624 [Boothiomyces sp. JEL0866]|nr:hypothetical protein HDV06_005624 [Boothiomyces sp. JEL0866]